MIEPEFIEEERLQLIQNYDHLDDSVYEDTQETSFAQQDDDDDEIPTRRPISDTRNRLKADMIVSLFKHMGWAMKI